MGILKTVQSTRHRQCRSPFTSDVALHVVTVRPETSVGEAIDISRRAPTFLRKYLYVLDDSHRLVGTLDARQCLLSEPSFLIGKLIQPEPIALRARASVREAKQNPAWEHFSIFPVVDRRNTFLGVVARAKVLGTAADRAADQAQENAVELSVDLAHLWWHMTSAFLIGTPKQEDQP